MPKNFLQLLSYILAISVSAALIITIIAFSATIFILAFTYIFIPLLVIAGVRWLWMKYKCYNQDRITFFNDKK